MRSKDEMSWAGLNKHYHPPGTEPGTLIEHHPTSNGQVRITLIQYSPDYFAEKTMASLEACWAEEKTDCITWINIEGICKPEFLATLGEHYHFHPLSMEDVLNAGQHSKMERYNDYYFLIMYLLSDQCATDARQVSIFWGKNYVITIVEEEEGAFEILRSRIRTPNARMRAMASDYLAYCIVDALVDRFFPRLEEIREEMDLLEESIFAGKEKEIIEKIHNIKKKLLILGKLVWGSQELIDAMQNEEVELTSPNIHFYLRDCFDHTVQLTHTIENYSEMSNGLISAHLSLISSQQNEIIKVLTMIATIFIPLTFIVGVYGMNFNPQAGSLSMPELNWPYGYVSSWAFMILLSALMLNYFRRKKWF